MLTVTSGFATRNAALAKMPIYVFTIASLSDAYSTHDLGRYSITGVPMTCHPWLKTPQGASQSIDVQAGSSSIGEMTCEVVDLGGAVRSVVGGQTLEGQQVQLLVGYPGSAWSDFVVLNTYKLYKIVPSKDYGSYVFSSRDVQMDSKTTIWNHPENGAPLSSSNPWVLQGTPCEIIQAVWLAGLMLGADTIDRATMAALDSETESMYGNSRPYLFSMVEPFQAKPFLEKLYQSAGMYPVVDALGRLSVRGFRAPAAGASPVFAFSADNVIGLPEFDRAPILNDLQWEIDAQTSASSSSGNYKTTLLFLNATSISLFQRSQQRDIQSDGLRTELGAQWWCQEVSQRVFDRFAGTSALRGGAPLISVTAFLATLPVWVGDYVSLTHPLMPNLFTGGLGLTNRVMEVVDRAPDYANGRMQYKLLDTGLTGAGAATSIGSAVIGTTTLY